MAVLKESKKQIIGVSSFWKDDKNFFRVEYVDWQKNGTYTSKKDWLEHDKLEKVIKFLIVDGPFVSNDKNFIWKSDKEICQELAWKSLVITTEIK